MDLMIKKLYIYWVKHFNIEFNFAIFYFKNILYLY